MGVASPGVGRRARWTPFDSAATASDTAATTARCTTSCHRRHVPLPQMGTGQPRGEEFEILTVLYLRFYLPGPALVWGAPLESGLVPLEIPAPPSPRWCDRRVWVVGWADGMAWGGGVQEPMTTLQEAKQEALSLSRLFPMIMSIYVATYI